MKRRIALVASLALLLAGCGSGLEVIHGSPKATPTDFAGLTQKLANHNLTVDTVVSGDAGCTDQGLAPMAISFTIAGLGEATPLPARLFRFRNDESYMKLRATVDTCAAEWVTDPARLLMIDASPYVLVMEGATDQAFIDALRTSLHEAAGN
ncbi:MAG: hypothetical protein NTW70_01905 [Chloroflexi bacterium]|nr:hypothetical protein [Chloroflexota bacterium]